MSSYTLKQLAEKLQAEVFGDGDVTISGVNTLDDASSGDISFVSQGRYLSKRDGCAATALILDSKMLEGFSGNALICNNPYLVFAKLSRLFYSAKQYTAGIAETAVVPASCQIGKGVYIGDYVVLGEHVILGDSCSILANTILGDHVVLGDKVVLNANVTLYDRVGIGDSSIIHSGAVIGADGFGYALDNERQWLKIPQVGSVKIGENVEIGANTTIDAGALNPTLVDDGVIVDNQVQIGHNVRIGKHTAIAAHAAIAGSTKIGAYCQIGGMAGIAGHLSIADNVIITGKAFVTKSINKAGTYSSAMVAEENKSWRKTIARLRNLDKMFAKIRALEKRVK